MTTPLNLRFNVIAGVGICDHLMSMRMFTLMIHTSSTQLQGKWWWIQFGSTNLMLIVCSYSRRGGLVGETDPIWDPSTLGWANLLMSFMKPFWHGLGQNCGRCLGIISQGSSVFQVQLVTCWRHLTVFLYVFKESSIDSIISSSCILKWKTIISKYFNVLRYIA
jgi:hypothetical protein